MINTPGFLNTRGWTLDNLEPFDRQAYIDALLSQHPAIPEDFRIWILEWPARLAIGCMWPGLPFIDSSTESAMRRPGVNWLGHKTSSHNSEQRCTSVRMRIIINSSLVSLSGEIRLLRIGSFSMRRVPNLFGRVYVIDIREPLSRSAIIPHNQLDPDDDYSDGYEPYINTPFDCWLSYLENYWNTTIKFDHDPTWNVDDRAISEPVKLLFNQVIPCTTPSPLWTERRTSLEYLN